MVTFDMNRRGGLTVNRESLHASPEYKRQIEALDKLRTPPMKPNLLDELEKIVALSEKATPGEWFISRSAPYYQYQLSAKCGDERTRVFATMDAMPFDAPANQRTANAEFVPSLVNWFRTHAPALADMAKRMEAAERDAYMAGYVQGCNDQACVGLNQDELRDDAAQAADHAGYAGYAIAATQEGEG